jgi:ABC-type multidrug transport system fused ATPase/permease subunit
VTGPRDFAPPPDDRRTTERRTPRDARVRAAIRDELGAPDDRPDAADPGPAEGAIIEIERVHLAFDDRVILEDVSFLAKKGETIAVVGESGTRKSTTHKQIQRRMVPDTGGV